MRLRHYLQIATYNVRMYIHRQNRNFNGVVGSLHLAQLLRNTVPRKKRNCDAYGGH